MSRTSRTRARFELYTVTERSVWSFCVVAAAGAPDFSSEVLVAHAVLSFPERDSSKKTAEKIAVTAIRALRDGMGCLLRMNMRASSERSSANFLQGNLWCGAFGPARKVRYGTAVQCLPPSLVWKPRPSVALIVADDASVATTLVKSASTGGMIVCHLFASLVRSTIPLLPTSQQTPVEGAEPATTCAVGLVHCVRQVAPASADIST